MHFWVESYPDCNPADAANIFHLDVCDIRDVVNNMSEGVKL